MEVEAAQSFEPPCVGSISDALRATYTEPFELSAEAVLADPVLGNCALRNASHAQVGALSRAYLAQARSLARWLAQSDAAVAARPCVRSALGPAADRPRTEVPGTAIGDR
jgi:hypothetical protein